MTAKAYCATHRGAYDVATGCAYCDPKTEPDTERTSRKDVDAWLRQYIEGITGEEIADTEWGRLWDPNGMYR